MTPDSGPDLKLVILAGGSGTRLWPLSRHHYPKQFLRLGGEHTLLQQTVLRLAPPGAPPPRPLVVCNEDHRFLVAEQLRCIDALGGNILIEPVGRNTAPALTAAALHARGDGADPLLLMLPADHAIADAGALREAVAAGGRLAAAGAIVTFGVVPTAPETGYGYVRVGADIGGTARRLDAFAEKPDPEAARRYLADGNHLWNSGMFLLRASTWLRAIDTLAPAIGSAVAAAMAAATGDGDFVRLDRAAFAASPSDSIDYAVMEKLAAMADLPAAVVPLAAGWSDVGSWAAVRGLLDRDAQGNAVRGDVFALDCRDSLLLAEHRLLAAIGCEDLVVVETADAVLVAHRDRAQDVKRIVAWLDENGRDERLTHRRVYRPWGSYESIDAGPRFQVKRITVDAGHSLSLQMHHHRAEHWIVVSGTARITRGEEEFLLGENQSTYIPLGVRHRLENPGMIPLEMIEVQSGTYLGEDDIVRFVDQYRRS